MLTGDALRRLEAERVERLQRDEDMRLLVTRLGRGCVGIAACHIWGWWGLLLAFGLYLGRD